MARILGTIPDITTQPASGRVLGDIMPSTPTPQPQQGLASKIWNSIAKGTQAVLGGEKVGEAIGTFAAKSGLTGLTPEERKYVSPGPTTGEVVGDAAQIGLTFAPLGTAAKGITAGAKALGLTKGAVALGKVGAGAALGLASDVAQNLKEGKIGEEALTPGFGTLVSSAIPLTEFGVELLNHIVKYQAPRVINSLIKPLLKDLSYGKNPGRAVADLGITGNSLEELGQNIAKARQEVGQTIRSTLETASTGAGALDLTDATSPIDKAINQAQKAPRTNSALIQRLKDAKDDIHGVVINEKGEAVTTRNLTNLTPLDSFNVKEIVADITKFTGNASDDNTVNKALKQVYGKIKEKINKTVPGIEPLNEQYADLTSAEIATKYRDKIVERQRIISTPALATGIGAAIVTAVTTGGAAIPALLAGAAGAGLEKALASAPVKTRVAAWLAKTPSAERQKVYEKIPALRDAIQKVFTKAASRQ